MLVQHKTVEHECCDYGVSGFDPLAYGAAAGLLLLIAGAANLVAAISASRVNPVQVLPSE